MATPPLRTALSDTYPLPSNATMRTGMGEFHDYVTGLLGATGDAAEARTALGADSSPRVMGLIGNVNAATPLTKFDLSADAVVLRNATGGTVTRYATGTITNDLGLAGPIANGRDQAAAFTVSSWVYPYFIWNDTTLASVSSASPPSTGPTLPTGYTHWAFATGLYLDSSGNIVSVFVRGATAHRQAELSALAAGAATSETTVSLAAAMPPIASRAKVRVRYANSNSASSSSMTLRLSTGINWTLIAGEQPETGKTTFNDMELEVPNVSQQMYYQNSATAASADISALSYTVPNGDS